MQTTIATPGTISCGRRLMRAALGLGLLSAFVFAQSGFAQSDPPLTFGNNFLVTGDFVVAGAQNMTTNFVTIGGNSYAMGTITIPDANPGIQPGSTSTCTINGVTHTNCVPAGAEIVAALLYWQTVVKITTPTDPALDPGANGFFRPLLGKNGPQTGYAIRGANLVSQQTTVSFSNGGCTGSSTGKVVRTYRADVRAGLPQDATGNPIANGTYEVKLASTGSTTPITLGATLVIIYRIQSPDVPLNSIVIYEGAFAPGNSTVPPLTMTQKVQGFYDAAANPVSRLGHIVGQGKSNKFQNVFLSSLDQHGNDLNRVQLNGSGQPAFPGFYGGWDNPVWTFPEPVIGNPVLEDLDSVKTEVVPSTTQQGCVSWGAVIFSTTVKNTDNDGLLDVWKKPLFPKDPNRPGYCDASVNEGVCNQVDPSWVDLPGAKPGQKDVFVQLDYMCSKVTGPLSCDTTNGNYSFDPRLPLDPLDVDPLHPNGKSAIDKVVDAFANPSHPVNLHVMPTHAIQEETCQDFPGPPLVLCPFPNQPGVVGWPGGIIFLENQLIDTTNGNLCLTTPPAATCVPVFQHGAQHSVHHVVVAHFLGLPNWTLQAGTLANVDTKSPGPNVMQTGTTVMFKTSTPHGLTNDPHCFNDNNGLGRVTIAYAITNPNLNGTYCVTVVDLFTFTIQAPFSTNFTYTFSTDPNFAAISGEVGTISGFSDIGGQRSAITVASWGDDGKTWQVKAGTIMHELGHQLGATHSGYSHDKLNQNPKDYTPTIGANCNSGFQSVMNYLFQVDLLDNGRVEPLTINFGLFSITINVPVNVPDYSEQVLNTLDESKTVSSNPFAGPFPTGLTPTYLSTSWYVPFSGVGTPATVHCDGTTILHGAQMSRVTDVTASLSWLAGQDINFNGNANESLRGHNDWTGTPQSPGLDFRQTSAAGVLSAPGAGGFLGGGGGGGGFLGGGGGGGGFLGGGGGGGGFLGGGGGGGGFLGGGGGGGGLLGGGGGLGELTRATANSVTRPPRFLTASEGASPRKITLNWTAPTFGQIGFYNVYRSENGGLFTIINALNTSPPHTVAGNPPVTTFTDTVTCDPGGFRYFVTAVLSDTSTNPGQESGPTNTVPSPTQGLLTGCYTNTLPATNTTRPDPVALTDLSFFPNTNFVQGVGPFPTITWTLQDDWSVQNDVYTPGGFVSSLTKNTDTLLAIGPIPNDAGCSTLTKPPTFLNFPGPGAYPYTVTALASGAGIPFTNKKFSVIWDTTNFNAGCYFFELDLDSGQSETSSALTLDIFVSDSTPHVTTTSLPDATVGVPYNNTVFESGGINDGVTPFSWTIVANSVMPGASSFLAGNPGISFLPNAPGITNGTLSGTPCVPGTYTFMVKVTDSVGNFGMQTLMLRVLAAPVAQVNQPVVPGSSVPAASGFTLTVNGTGFVSCSSVLWNGTPRATIFKSATQLTASILAADVLTFGTASISVANTGSPSSNVDFFQITNPTTAVSLSRADLATGVSPNGLIAADFNGDGKLDLAIANSGDKTVSILLGNGDGTFITEPTLAAGNGPSSLIAGDFNNDGKLDLAVTNFTDGNVSIFIGNGDGTFKAAVNYAVGSGPFSMVTGDFKGRGKLDLAVANQNDHTISILLGNGDGTFQLQATYAAVIAGAGTLDAADLALGDFNGDGKVDLAVTNPSTDQVSILLGNGDGTFQNPVSYSTGPAQSHPIAVTAADFNGDGKLDLAVTNLNTRNVAIFLGNGNGTFQPQVSYSTTGGAMIGPSAITTGDFNGDGLLDIAVTDQNDNSVSILLGNGNGTFQGPLEFTTGNFSAGVAAGDFNGDGRLDVAVANQNSNTVSIMLQPQVLLVPSALAFGSVAEGAPTARVVNLTNNGPGALTISTIVINPGAFSQINNCPITPTTLAPGATCTINVSFGPTVTGVQGSTLVITDNARDTPQNVSLAGSGFVAPPTNLAANTVAGSGAVTLAWSASVSASGGYNVYRATVSGGPYVKIASSVATTGYMDSGLTSGTTYYYVTTAVDASANESAFSNQASATP